MPTDIADVIKDINKRLIAAEGQIFGFTQLVHALVASNSVSTVILREHIELLLSRLVPADATDEATTLYIEAARDLMSEILNQEGATRSIQFCRDHFGAGVRFRHSSKEGILLWRPPVAM
jgi:hypothetical protein